MNLDALLAHEFDSVEQQYTQKDSMIYALGLGYGDDPLDEAQLQFLYEDRIRMVPSMSMVLGHPGMWAQNPKFGVDWVKLLHAEQRFEIHKPLAPAGKIRARHSFQAVQDKGPDKGALVYQQKTIHDQATDELLATIGTTLFLRGDGGCGNYGEAPAPAEALPDEAADFTMDIKTLPQSALIYRLSGDWNPIHADPATAAKAGFEQPILHGLCTMGLACRALIAACCDHNPDRLKSMFVRFTRPVFPGETIRFEFFENESKVRFRARVVERDMVVLDRADATLNG